MKKYECGNEEVRKMAAHEGEESSMKRDGMIEKRKKMTAAVMAAVLSAVLTIVPKETVQAQETPFVDISTDLVSLSPQAAEVKMNVAARNMAADTTLAFTVADGSICSVEWVEPEDRGYTQLKYKRGEVLGETAVTIFVKDHPEIARQILVTNREVADSFMYEGNGSLDIYGLNLSPIPYEVRVVSADENGYFGLVYQNPVGERTLLVNRMGAFESSATIPQGADGAYFQVAATGHWQITVTPILTAAAPTQSGSGNLVSGLFRGDDKSHDVYCRNWAEKGNYIVWLYDITDNTKKLLANGAGTCAKRTKNVRLDASHSYYVSVESAGDWLVEFSK